MIFNSFTNFVSKRYRHNNLYTAECILKNSCNPKSYALLYSFQSPSKLLTEYANENKEMAQQQENANIRLVMSFFYFNNGCVISLAVFFQNSIFHNSFFQS